MEGKLSQDGDSPLPFAPSPFRFSIIPSLWPLYMTLFLRFLMSPTKYLHFSLIVSSTYLSIHRIQIKTTGNDNIFHGNQL